MANYVDTEMAMLYDSSRCTACKGCQIACKQWNVLYSPLGMNVNPFTGSYQAPEDLNGSNRLIMTFHEKNTGDLTRPVQWAFGRRSCFHCTNAGCVTVCPTGALSYRKNGIVGVDKEKCIGCQYCESACPFDVPRYYGEETALIDKCTMCWERLENGRVPACVKTCQPGALHFGPRKEMIQLAHERVDFLKKKGFEKAEVYGEKELGGLHVIQVCKFGHEAHGLPTDPQVSSVAVLGQLSKPTTGVVAAATAAGLFVSFVAAIGYRRKKLSIEERVKTWTPAQQKEAAEIVTDRLEEDKRQAQSDNY